MWDSQSTAHTQLSGFVSAEGRGMPPPQAARLCRRGEVSLHRRSRRLLLLAVCAAALLLGLHCRLRELQLARLQRQKGRHVTSRPAPGTPNRLPTDAAETTATPPAAARPICGRPTPARVLRAIEPPPGHYHRMLARALQTGRAFPWKGAHGCVRKRKRPGSQCMQLSPLGRIGLFSSD